MCAYLDDMAEDGSEDEEDEEDDAETAAELKGGRKSETYLG